MKTDKSKKVRNYYDQFSSSYENFYSPIQEKKYREIIQLLNFKHAWCLDHGGGTGLLSQWTNFAMVTLDISIEMLRYGVKQKRDFLPVAGDIEKIPFRKKGFNHIFSFTSIQNANNFECVFRELERISNQNTRGIISYLRKSPQVGILHKSLKNSQYVIRKIYSETEDEIFIVSFNKGNLDY